MIAAMEQQPKESRRLRLLSLLSWIEGHENPMQISVRPYCRVHRDTLMNAGKTEHGQTHYYCPKCRESLKVKPRVV